MGEPCPAPLRVAMRSPLPFPCVPYRPSKILLVQVGTLSFSHPLFGVSVLFIYLFDGFLRTEREFLEVHLQALIHEKPVPRRA